MLDENAEREEDDNLICFLREWFGESEPMMEKQRNDLVLAAVLSNEKPHRRVVKDFGRYFESVRRGLPNYEMIVERGPQTGEKGEPTR